MIGIGFGDNKDEAVKDFLEREYPFFSNDFSTTRKEFKRKWKIISAEKSYGRRWEIHYEKRGD